MEKEKETLVETRYQQKQWQRKRQGMNLGLTKTRIS
ncbi:hypothetical protein BGS_1145 [Beggiatoa sp. SS]|nr:hypothetical protein BGS_1145 [Beggiatoa sp. SS]